MARPFSLRTSAVGLARRGSLVMPGATLDLDFANGSYYPSNLLSTTRASAGTAQATSGLWTSFGNNVARRTDKGLLPEVTRTRLNSYNRDLGGGTWTTGPNGSASQNAVGIDGTENSASTVTLTATNATARVAYNQTVTAETQYTLSFFAKAGTASGPHFLVYDVSNAANITGETDYTPGNGEFARVTHTFTTPSGCTLIQMQPVRSPDSTGTIIIDAFQLEQAAFATSPILHSPTSAHVARSADDYTLSSMSWLTAGQGTIFAEVEVPANPADFQSFYLSDGTTNNRIHVGYQHSATRGIGWIINGGATQAAIVGASGLSPGDVFRVAMAYNTNDARIAVDGALGNSDASVTVPTVNAARLGGITTANNVPNSYIRRVGYTPLVLANGDLAAVTAGS